MGMRHASDWHNISLSDIDCTGPLRDQYSSPFVASIQERFNRQWHIVVVGSGVSHDGASLQYKATGVGAFSQWDGNTSNPPKCPFQLRDSVRDAVVKFETAYMQI